MSKILFLYSEDYNEVFPSIGLVQELIKNGNEVIYYSGFRFKELVESVGATFMDYAHFTLPPSGPPFVSQEDINQVLYSTVFYNIKVRNIFIGKIFETVKELNPDLIIHNHQTYWGKEIAKRLELPHICLYPGMVVNKELFSEHPETFIQDFFGNLFSCSAREFNRLYPILNKAFKNIYGLEDIYDGLISDADLNIVYTSREFQPYVDQLNEGQYKFVGYSTLKAKVDVTLPEEVLALKENMIYVSGTPADKYHKSWNSEFYPVLLNALKGTEKNYILNYHCADQSFYDLQEIPDNVKVIDNLMYHDLLIKNAEMVITHGSFSVVQESLRQGIPVIIIPVGSDHFLVAKQIEELELGIYLRPKEFSAEALQKAIKQIQTDEGYRNNCVAYAKKMQEMSPDAVATTLITEYIER